MAYKIDWAKARKDFEKAGLSTGQIADKYGVTASAVLSHKKKDGWQRVEPDQPETVVGSFAPEQTVRSADIPGIEARKRIAELEAELARAEQQIGQQEQELEKHRPTLEWHVYRTAQEVRDYFGDERLQDIAGLELAEQNKARVKRGLAPFNYEHDQALYDRAIAKIVDEMLSRRTKFIDPQKRCRVVKMAARAQDGTWNVVQIPVEVQINNEAGQSGSAIWKQRDKGRKLVMPYLCQRIDCWQEAKVGADGKFEYAGYCSQECLATDPYLQKQAIPGIAMSRAVGV